MHERERTGKINMDMEYAVDALSTLFPGIDEGYARRVAQNPLTREQAFYDNLLTIISADEDLGTDTTIEMALRWTNKLPTDTQEIARRARIGRRYEEEMRLLGWRLHKGLITEEQYQIFGGEISDRYSY